MSLGPSLRPRWPSGAGPILCLGLVGCGPILGIEETVYKDCDLAPTRIFFADKIVADTQVTVGAIGRRRLGEIAGELGATLDPNKGHVLAGVTDCDDNLIEDASVSIEPGFDGGTELTVEDVGVSLGSDTSSPGLAGVLNVPVTTELMVEAYPDELDGALSSIGDVTVAAGELGFIVLRPNSEAPVPDTTPPTAFACVGQPVGPPEASTARIVFDVFEADAFRPIGEPIEGVRFRFCEGADPRCEIDLSQPLDDAVEVATDENGQATLVVPTPGPDGFDGSVRMAGRLATCE